MRLGAGGGGCISNTESYETDRGTVFVKYHRDPKVLGELYRWLACLMHVDDVRTLRR